MTAGWAAVLAGIAVLVGAAPGRAPGAVNATVLRWWTWFRTRVAPERRKPTPARLPEVLELLAAALATGVPLARALDTLAELADDQVRAALDQVRVPLALGSGEGDAWLRVADMPGWEEVAPDLAMAADAGSSVLGLLAVHADEIRREAAASATRRARAVGVRAVLPLMTCFLPAFVLVGVVPIIVGLVSGFLGG